MGVFGIYLFYLENFVIDFYLYNLSYLYFISDDDHSM